MINVSFGADEPMFTPVGYLQFIANYRMWIAADPEHVQHLTDMTPLISECDAELDRLEVQLGALD
jgi:hypothetical protein